MLFENSIAAGCFTPICMSSVLTGCYPNKHTVRDPYCTIQRPTIAEILKENGWRTAGFSGNGVLGSAHGFARGFGSYDEPDDREGHHFDTWQPDSTREVFYGGNWWVDRFHEWMEKNHAEQPFFVWGHLYHTHRGGEVPLLEQGKLAKQEDPWMYYYDEKLSVCDAEVMGRLIASLKKWGMWEDTTLIFCSDHGTNLGDRPATPPFYRPHEPPCPCHLNLYDINVRVACIIKDPDLPEGRAHPGPGALGGHHPHDPGPGGHPGGEVRHGRRQPGAGGEGRAGRRGGWPTRRTCRSGRRRTTRCARACAPRISTSCATCTTARRSGTRRPTTRGRRRT